MSANMRVLTVLSDNDLAQEVKTVLSRRAVEVHRVPSGAGALILTGNLSYDLIIVEHPLADLEVEDFVGSIRTLDSTSTLSPVLVLAPESKIEVLEASFSDNLVRVVPRTLDQATLHAVFSSLLGVAFRRSTRVMVQVEVGMEAGVTTRMYQAVNLSESGLLLRGGTQIPVGTPVRFEFTLPESGGGVIEGVGLVVRHTAPEEGMLGVAIQFAELAADNLRRLRSFSKSCGSEVTMPPAQEARRQRSAQTGG